MDDMERTLTTEGGSRTGILFVSGEIDQHQVLTHLRLSNGDTLALPTELLLQKINRSTRPKQILDSPSEAMGDQVVPVVEERLKLAKRTVETGTVQLVRSSEAYSEAVEIPLTSVSFDVTRHQVNRLVSERPAPRQMGETTIYSIVEERVIVATELILKEEVHVTRRETVTSHQEVVTLRRDHVDVKRT